METLIIRPEIAIDQFLPIFIESTLVLVFGVVYAALITLAKMGYFSKEWMSLGYLFWALQAYCLYDLSVLIQSNPFTTKVLMVTMDAYLFIPHLYFYLIGETEKRYGDSENHKTLNYKRGGGNGKGRIFSLDEYTILASIGCMGNGIGDDFVGVADV